MLIRKHLKQFRTSCVLEALENWDDLGILQDAKLTDQDFFLRLPKVKYSAEDMQMVQETENSYYSDEDFEMFSKEDSKNH